MKLYKGTVVFGAGEPRDVGYGPSVNVLIKMDDANAPKTDDPKTKEGEVRIYKKAYVRDNPEEPTEDYLYMKSMNRGDRVTMAWNEAGDKSNYSFITPDGPETPLPPVYHQPKGEPTPVQTTRSDVFPVPPDGNEHVWDFVTSRVLDMYDETYKKVLARYPDHDNPHGLAARIHGWSNGWWRPGVVMGNGGEAEYTPSPPPPPSRDAFLSMINQDADMATRAKEWLGAALVWLDETSQEDVLGVITKLGIQSSEWINTQDGQWKLLQVVEDYLTQSQSGLAHADILPYLNREYGVKMPAPATPDPIF